jgi:phage terminase large subunit-like protein
MNLAEIGNLEELSDEELREKLASVLSIAQKDRQENALQYFKPVSDIGARVFESDARVFAIGGGNGSGKTEQVLAFAVACATGVFPDCMRHLIGKRFRGPIRVRIVCESITTVLYPTMLPKLQWWNWTGVDEQGGERGHWGWIPPYCLKDRDWTKSWSEKLRMLTVLCRDPENLDRVLGESVIQFMSYDQDPSDFASGDYHIVVHDEPPPLAIWRENEARTMRVAGRILLSMTWPDDPSIPVDWIFDEVYEPGLDEKRKDIEWINLYSTANPHLKQEAVALQSKSWTDEMRRVRIYGQPIRFSNRVHPLFTDQTQHWCFACGKTTIPEDNPHPLTEYDKLMCASCGGLNVAAFNHVREFDVADKWPVIWALDPHPRKPHMALWVMVDPSDDWWVPGRHGGRWRPRGRAQGGRSDRDHARPERGRAPHRSEHGAQPLVVAPRHRVAGRLRPGGARDDARRRLRVGRKTLNQLLKPDDRRLQPRVHVHPRAHRRPISQMKRYSWDNYKRADEKDVKQTPKAKYDDYPDAPQVRRELRADVQAAEGHVHDLQSARSAHGGLLMATKNFCDGNERRDSRRHADHGPLRPPVLRGRARGRRGIPAIADEAHTAAARLRDRARGAAQSLSPEARAPAGRAAMKPKIAGRVHQVRRGRVRSRGA